MHFTWDPRKARENLQKHGVSFEEAKLTFYDPFAIWEPDQGHPERGVLIGAARTHRVLFVVHIDLSDEHNDVFRIISARKASAAQTRRYRDGDTDRR